MERTLWTDSESACEGSNVDPQDLKLMLARFLPEYTPAADGVRSGDKWQLR